MWTWVSQQNLCLKYTLLLLQWKGKFNHCNVRAALTQWSRETQHVDQDLSQDFERQHPHWAKTTIPTQLTLSVFEETLKETHYETEYKSLFKLLVAVIKKEKCKASMMLTQQIMTVYTTHIQNLWRFIKIVLTVKPHNRARIYSTIGFIITIFVTVWLEMMTFVRS